MAEEKVASRMAYKMAQGFIDEQEAKIDVNKVFVGYQQMEAIIREIMVAQRQGCSGRGYPSWDFINNVLSCKAILGENKLWFHWGKLLIHRPADEYKEAIAHEELQDWNTESDGSITLIGKPWESD